MKSGNLDELIMLLSTDWFSPYWSALGIGVEREKKTCLQEGCREIVKQIMSGSKEYWQTSFSHERVSRTNEMLQALVENCGADRSVTDRINALIRQEEISEVDEGTGWLVLSITEQLLQDSLEEGPQLDTGIREIVARAWDMANRTESSRASEVEQLCLTSESTWDIFVRNTTPDLPTRLSDYLSAVASKDKFARFWAAVIGSLSANEKRELVSWYRTAGESTTGERLRLPQET